MKKLVLFSLLIVISCTKKVNKEVLVFNVDDKGTKVELSNMDLDKKHPNLLNPSISKGDYDSVLSSWVDLHKELQKYLNQNNFDWGIDDDKIKIFNKIYFDKNGRVEAYVYKVLSKNTEKKSDEYGKLMLSFLKEIKISVVRDFPFAQCGKISLPNKNKKV